MKLNVKLTADELMDVLEAAETEAFNRSWPVEWNGEPDNDVCADIFAIMDAGLSTIGIEIEEEIEAEDEMDEDELEDWDEDEESEDEESEPDPIEDMIFVQDGKRCISSDNARLLFTNMLAVVEDMYEDMSSEARFELAKHLLIEFSKERRIEWVVGE